MSGFVLLFSVGQLVLVSSTHVTVLLLLAYQPNSLLGAFTPRKRGDGNLVLKLASRLDAFSGYPFRT